MATTHTKRPARTPTAPGRFARPGAGAGRTGHSAPVLARSARAGRRAQSPRRGVAGGWLQRSKPQQQSGVKTALSKATSVLPGATGRRSPTSSRGRGGKAGGLAVLAGVAGLAFTHRDKLTAMLRDRSGHSESVEAPMPHETTTPAADTTIDPHTTGSLDRPPSTTGDDAV